METRALVFRTRAIINVTHRHQRPHKRALPPTEDVDESPPMTRIHSNAETEAAIPSHLPITCRRTGGLTDGRTNGRVKRSVMDRRTSPRAAAPAAGWSPVVMPDLSLSSSSWRRRERALCDRLAGTLWRVWMLLQFSARRDQSIGRSV